MMFPRVRIVDISQPIHEATACFPGDVPFSRRLTVDYAGSGVMNLTAFTMSPHVGTHADAPVHVRGEMAGTAEAVGHLPLEPFVGPAAVIDVSPCTQALTWERVAPLLETPVPERLLFRTRTVLRPNVWESDYAWLSVELIEALAARGVRLVGLDTPSVDAVDSKTLETHHALLRHQMAWLENLDLSNAPAGNAFLVAAPLKFTTLEASPVRAFLLLHA